jgi:hypothetical protein
MNQTRARVAANALQEKNKQLAAAGSKRIDLTDPEEVTNAIQNMYNMSDSEADELGMEVWELL